MDKEDFLSKLAAMTIEEKLALLSDADKAYLKGYLDRAVLEFQSCLREPVSKKNASQSNIKMEPNQ
jgi:hypothetical protein